MRHRATHRAQPPGKLTVDADRGLLLVTSYFLGGIAAVDIDSGDRVVVTDEDTGHGPPLADSSELQLMGRRALFMSPLLQAAGMVDSTKGDRVLLSR